MVTDLDQIRRLAGDKQLENLRFRRYLKEHRVPHSALEQIAHEIAAAIDCTACANCCRETFVTPTREDLAAIAGYLQIPLEQAVRLYTVPDHSAEHGVRLRQTPDACVFLDGSVCIVYDARPQVCRRFPYAERAETSLGGRMSSVCRNASFCPILYNALEELKRVTGFHPVADTGTKAPGASAQPAGR